MSTKFLVNLDLNKNQLLNAVIQNLGSHPTTGMVEGQIYANTTDHKMYRYSNNAWVELGGSGGAGDVTGPASSTDANLAKFSGAGGKTLADSGVSTSSVSDAVSQKHTQNSDTGTSGTTFQLDNGNTGPKLKNNAGVLEVRNAADSGYADLTVANLTVSGTTTTVNSTTVAIADNVIVLNKDVTGSPTTNGGIEVERGTADNASLIWDESTDAWKAGTAGAELSLARKYAANIGNGTDTTIVVTHGLGTQDVAVSVRLVASPYSQVLCDVEHTSTTTVTLKFAVAPTTAELRVTVIG